MSIDKAELCGLIPHGEAMCLLDAISAWDRVSIDCHSTTHLSPSNPLRRGGRLAALHAFEYAAQAVAVHGGLMAREEGAAVSPGYLAALKNGRLHVDYLDAVDQPLEINARQRLRTVGSFIYDATVSGDGRLLAAVQLTVMTFAKEQQ